jgi:hypothetical protein
MQPVTLTLNDKNEIADVDFVQWIMKEIEDKVMTRKEVASTYAILLCKPIGSDDIRKINQAILARWSPSGLRWIKERAYCIAKEKRAWAKYGGCTCMGHGECNFCRER